MQNQIPEKIGNVTIVNDPKAWNAARNEGVIILPEISEVHILKNDSQALAVLKRGQIIFFGQDDGHPFVAGISKNAFMAFKSAGENAFYEALKPWSMRILSSLTTTPILRQGDIWAIRIADSWKNIGDSIVAFRIAKKYKKREEDDMPIFRTRHRLTGASQRILIEKGRRKSRTKRTVIEVAEVMIASGKIEAPDHPVLNLADGIYAIARSSGLRNDVVSGGD